MKRTLLFFIILFLMSCVAHQEGVIQKADLSYIVLKGNFKRVNVQIDDDKPFQTEESQGKILYQLRPGKHIIKVFRDKELIVNRILFLDNQTTTEVLIP
jgi:cell envelope opacity-associated protein A